jgi:hypothetical protein
VVSIRTEVVTVFTEVADEQGKRLTPLSDDLALLDSGLDSLCLAIIVARLDDRLGFDPFSVDSGDTAFPLTIGEFIELYEHAGA